MSYSLSVTNNIKLSWIKAHKDFTGNEFADLLAKRGGHQCNVQMTTPMATSVLKNQIKLYFTRTWQSKWTQESTCRQTKLFVPNVGTFDYKYLLKQNRQTLRRLIQFSTGHCTLRRHLHLQGKVESPTCRLCDRADETPFHLLRECPETLDLRNEATTEHPIARTNQITQSERIKRLMELQYDDP